MTDKNGDGMLGNIYYSRGHATFKPSLMNRVITILAGLGAGFIIIVVLGAILNINVAQEALEYVIAGKQ